MGYITVIGTFNYVSYEAMNIHEKFLRAVDGVNLSQTLSISKFLTLFDIVSVLAGSRACTYSVLTQKKKHMQNVLLRQAAVDALIAGMNAP
jgi:arginine repressor